MRALLLAALLLAPALARAAGTVEWKPGAPEARSPVRFFAALEYWAQDGVRKHDKGDVVDPYVAQQRAAGFSVGGANHYLPGMGLRVGGMYRWFSREIDLADENVQPMLEAGLSYGYIQGPRTRVDLVSTQGAQYATAEYHSDLDVSRVLAEVDKPVAVSGRLSLVPGLAAGYAWLREKRIGRSSADSPEAARHTVFIGGTEGLTWEASLALRWDAGPVDVDLAFKYTAFRRVSLDHFAPDVTWIPWGLSLGVSY